MTRSTFIPAALALAAAVVTGNVQAGAIISAGDVKMGINDTGELNYSDGTLYAGIFYVPTGNDGTRAGCPCEGWGVADETTGVQGAADQAIFGNGGTNLSDVVFSSDADSASSTVTVRDGAGAPKIQVMHDYEPASTNTYRVRVTIKNVGATPIVPRYTRLMDWDVEPTAFSEFVTFVTGSAANLIYNDDNGFANPLPLTSRSPIDAGPGDFTDSGADDHGALFDFRFDTLAPGDSLTFDTYYGATGNEADALGELASVGAETYSLGQTSIDPSGGTPNTFYFGFSGVGGTPVFPTVTESPDTAVGTVGGTTSSTATVEKNGAPLAGQLVTFSVIDGPNAGQASAPGECSPSDCTTDAAGKSTWSYTSNGTAGTDVVEACIVSDGISICDDVTREWGASGEQPVVRFNKAAVATPEGTKRGVVLSLSKPSPVPVTVTFGVGGTASSPADFVAQPGSKVVTFPAGKTKKRISIRTRNDTIDDDDETVVLHLLSANGATVDASKDTSTLTIIDND